MNTFVVDEPTANVGPLPSVFEHFPRTATQAQHAPAWRRFTWMAGLLTVPAVTVLAGSRVSTRWRGLLAGGLTAVALGALRVELARWFTPEPAYHSEGKLGDLELRRYDARIEAQVEVDVPALEPALDRGYGRLAAYVCGVNRTGEMIPRTMPVITAMRDGRYTVSFVMPPGRDLGSLPRPMHPGVELCEIRGRRVAALRFRGRFTRDNVAAAERHLLARLIDAGLSARGSVGFAAFDSPAVLPILRRNELWIEIV